VRNAVFVGVIGISLLTGVALVNGRALSEVEGQGGRKPRLNPMIELLEQNKPVFGLYAPSNRRPGGRGARGAPAPADAPAPPQKTPLELAKDALAYKQADFIFDGSMEGGVDRGLPAYAEFVKGMQEAGALRKAPFLRLTHPLVVKMQEIAPEPDEAIDAISKQLNLGVSGIMFVKAESADEVKKGIAAMRFKSNGGTRLDSVGSAPAYWGLSDAEYRQRADVWPLNPNGELVNWTIIESKEGLAHAREIAAVPGIGVLWPGAGTLRGVFSTTDANGQRQTDLAAWENAIQTVLSTCKEFKLACGYPATPDDIELRMKQGFSVFVMNWGDTGFKAIEIGRRVGNRTDTTQ
jgi:4-hydroxy-2-oxoheptanedioate aldolase